MRDYGKIYTSFWTSETTRALSDDGRLLALYLLSSPHTNMIGAFRAPDGYVSEDLKWGFERVSKGFRNLKDNGFATRDEVSKWVVIHKHLEWNEIENPNQAKSAIKLLESVPDTVEAKPDVARLLLSSCERFRDKLLPDFLNRLKTLSKPFRNQEQEQEQEQDITTADAVVCPEPSREDSAPNAPPPASSTGRVNTTETPVLTLPTNRFSTSLEEFAVTQDMVTEWQQAYPAVDVQAELRKIRAWCLANDQRRKTKSGMKRFVNAWLAKAQNAGPRPAAVTQFPAQTAGRHRMLSDVVAEQNARNSK